MAPISILQRTTIEAAGFFALRTPLLSFDELLHWSERLSAPEALHDAAALDGALADDRRRLRTQLVAAIARPEVREALFVASPSLDDSLPHWLQAPDSERGQKVEKTLVRYFLRMAGRSTPFGLFAGCSVGHVGSVTNLALGARAAHRRHTRLDGDYLAALTEALGRDRDFWRQTLFYPNSSLYKAAGRLRYAESRARGKQRTYHLVGVEPDDYLEATLARARGGARFDALVEPLLDDETTRDEAEAFIAQLIESQLLISALTPQVTGPEPIHDLVAQLVGHRSTAALGAQLGQARDALAQLDRQPLGATPAHYRAIAATLEGLPAPVELARLFQVDLVKPAPDATLGADVVAELTRGVQLLHRIAPPASSDPLARFREAFQTRYEGREVPLVEALDDESGIGFDKARSSAAAPLIDGLNFGGGPRPELTRWGAPQALLLRKLERALKTGAREIALDEADLVELANAAPAPLPGALAALATVAARSPDELAAGRFRLWLSELTGPSGANVLGRFCHGDDALHRLVLAHLRDEESQLPDAIHAEIVHLPAGRVGNVLLRPLLRAYEIPLLGRSGAPAEQQIPVDDLLVSVQGETITLRSRTHGRQVVPRLTTAHNFASTRNLSVYRFLCALQWQGLATLGWSWGALDAATFLPRVTSGRLVLALARWRVDAAFCQRLGEAEGARRFVLMQELRAELALPRWVAVSDGDNVLPMDLDNALVIDTFAQLVKTRSAVTLTEVWPPPDELCAHGPEGRFVHELVVPLVCRRDDATPRLVAPSRPSPEVARAQLPRTRLPGSDWLYAKLYTGAATADQLLRELVAPVVRAAQASGAVDQWFFIRYGDPDWHLRLRLHGDPERLCREVLPALEAATRESLANGQLWKLQLDSYERELGRYGGPFGMVLSERLFQYDSEAVLAIVEMLAGDEGADARWRLALRGMDRLLDDLGFDLAAKAALVGHCRDEFAREFHSNKRLEKQIGDKYRNERIALERLFDAEQEDASELAPALRVLRERSRRMQPLAAELRRREAAGELTLSVAQLATSYLHMHANRVLRAEARAQELVLYDFLARIYESRRARTSRAGAAARGEAS